MNSNRIESIDILKGIGIVLMVGRHCNFGELASLYISSFHMQLFFILSGYLYVNNRYTFSTYFLRKLKALMLPFLFFSIVTILFCVLINTYLSEDVFALNNMLWGLIYINRSIFPITGAIWFLECLFISNIIFYLLCKYLKPSYLFLLFVVIIVLNGHINKLSYTLPFTLDSVLSALVFIYIGYIYKKITDSYSVKKEVTSLTLVILFIIISILIFFNGDVNPRTCQYGDILLYFFNASMMTWLIFHFVKKTNGIYCANPFLYIGRNSILFLGFNQIVIYCFYHLFNVLFPFESVALKGIRNVMIFVLTMFCLCVISQIFEKTKLKYLIGKF